jgi:hypothetical protein
VWEGLKEAMLVVSNLTVKWGQWKQSKVEKEEEEKNMVMIEMKY